MAKEVKKGAVKNANEVTVTPKTNEKTFPVTPKLRKGTRLRPVIDVMMDENITVSEFANRVGITKQAMSYRFYRDDVYLSAMEKMAEAIGYEFVWSFRKKEQ